MFYLEIIVRYIHFISMFVIVATLTGEYLLLEKTLSRAEIRKIANLDRLYGLAAITILGAGFSLWFLLGKSAAFYTYNAVFWIKIGFFTIVGLLSIKPTLFFMREGKQSLPEAEINVPPVIRQFIVWEIILLTIIPLLANLMARGAGYFG